MCPFFFSFAMMNSLTSVKFDQPAPVFSRIKAVVAALTLSVTALGASPVAHADVVLLNVSYDVTRELFRDVNPVFAAEWKKSTGETIVINQSHGGSSAQARAVAEGLDASVVTMNQSNDIDILVAKGLVSADWSKRFPNNSAPFYSTIVYLTRKGNPKNIHNWDDLAKPGVKVIIPNPKTSGNGRYSYLAAWGSVIKRGGSDADARSLVTRLFKNAPILDAGGRAATTTFTQRDIGDVLVTFENEALLALKEFGDKFEIIYPNASILAESPVTVVDKVVDKRGIRKQATAYLQFLYSPQGQRIIAQHGLRPRLESRELAATFKPINLFTIDEIYGSWKNAQKRHFDDGGEFDQIYQSRN